MFNSITNRLLALLALLAVGGSLRADLIIRAGPITVRVGQGVSVEVRPRVSGLLETQAFSDGQMVRKGQLLFVIDPRPYQAAAAKANAAA